MSDTFNRVYASEAEDDPPFHKLSREEAQALRDRHPSVSPWRVVAAQAAAGVLCAALAWALTASGGTAASMLYGAAAMVIPSALLACGMTIRSPDAVSAAAGVLLWEMVKIGVAVAMLAAAPTIVPGLQWPAVLLGMLAGFIMNWAALLWQGRRAPKTN